MPTDAQGLEPPSITARADRGERIALDVRRKLLPAYGAALEAARSQLADIDRLKARRKEAADRLAAALPASRYAEDRRDDSVTVRSHLRLPASTPDGAANARVVARVEADGATADIRADWLPVDVAAEIMRITGRSAAAPLWGTKRCTVTRRPASGAGRRPLFLPEGAGSPEGGSLRSEERVATPPTSKVN